MCSPSIECPHTSREISSSSRVILSNPTTQTRNVSLLTLDTTMAKDKLNLSTTSDKYQLLEVYGKKGWTIGHWTVGCISKHRKSAKLPSQYQTLFLVFVFLTFCVFVILCFLSFLGFCNFDFLAFLLFVFLPSHHCDQMSEGSQVSNVTLCAEILKWHSMHSIALH